MHTLVAPQLFSQHRTAFVPTVRMLAHAALHTTSKLTFSMTDPLAKAICSCRSQVKGATPEA